ncbi:hypothetical protein C2845_PM05G09250 [Panicum miliaceum]|uniref:Uncharacterized protein n=1 Tax=Panicum miliaceum TaxID=4540 RepID=A0A3L6T2U7_PANMI|nr:hypothetical protein C2845_PM05G09250 [Panicum miliaceum]
MASCWSSVLAVLGVHAQAADVEKGEESKAAALHRRLLDDWAAATAEEEEVRNLTAEVEELRRALDAQEERDARIRELEDRIKELNNTHSKWRFF